MRKISIIFALVLGSVLRIQAQSIPVTNGAAICSNCVPSGWFIITGQPDLSNSNYCGTTNLGWKNPLPATPSGGRTFLSLYVNNENGSKFSDVVETSITGLTPGKHYTVFLNVIPTITSANANYPQRFSAKFVAGGASDDYPSGSSMAAEVTFGGNDYGKWKRVRIRFLANGSTAIIRFLGDGSNFGGGYIGIDVASGATLLCKAGTAPVTLSNPTDINLKCAGEVVNLNSKVTSVTPNEANLVWFDGPRFINETNTLPNPSAISFADTLVDIYAGTYSPYYYDPKAECFNELVSSQSIKISTPKSVALKDSVIQATCPDNKADITTLLNGSPPAGMYTVWYTTNNHAAASEVTGPKTSVPGTYYAFNKSTTNGCFNTNKSKSKVRVKEAPKCDVDLTLSLFLQGPKKGNAAEMNNFLQAGGLLPTLDPYGNLAKCNTINDPLSITGKVVDWINVEIRDVSKPSLILESKSLLLRTDGLVVGVDGKVPVFKPQLNGVMLVVKHRNHLPVMSNALEFKAPSAFYNFSGELIRAYNDPNSPASPQMVLKNGIWCLWAWDANQDLTADGTDYNNLFNKSKSSPYDVYVPEDIDMNGVVDATDLNSLYIGSKVSPYSILLNY